MPAERTAMRIQNPACVQDLQRSSAGSSAAPSPYPFLLFRWLFCVGPLLRTRFSALT